MLAIAADVVTFTATYASAANVGGGWTGRLSNRSEPVELFELLGLKGGWLRHSLHLEELRVQSVDIGHWNAAAGIEFSGMWPLTAKGSGELPALEAWPELVRRNIAFDASGQLDGLTVQTDIAGRFAVSANAVLNVLDSQLPFQLQATVAWSEKLALSELLELPEALAAITLTSPLSLVASGDLLVPPQVISILK